MSASDGVDDGRAPSSRPCGPARERGHKLLVPYVTGGLDDEWLLVVEALAGAGADAIELGIPFSDPMIDGPSSRRRRLRALGGAPP